jgi:hypothetical protein
MGHRKVHAFLLVLLGVVLALTAPVAGRMKATFSTGGGGGPGPWSGDAALLQRLMSMRLEDRVTLELTVDLELHRCVLLSGSIRPSVFTLDRAACLGRAERLGAIHKSGLREDLPLPLTMIMVVPEIDRLLWV